MAAVPAMSQLSSRITQTFRLSLGHPVGSVRLIGIVFQAQWNASFCVAELYVKNCYASDTFP